jgi:hypothetical protein
MKIIAILLISMQSYSVFADPAKDAGVVHHPTPTEPKLIAASWYDTLKKQVTPPPQPGSKEQRKDEELILKLQARRTDKECAAAQHEVSVSLATFFEGKNLLSKAEVEKLNAFFLQLRNDGDYFVQKLKRELPRKRPFVYLSAVKPCVPKEVTDAYPSGHAVLSRLYALVLGDLYPARKDAFNARAEEIAMHRVISGMHHPSDIAEGQKIGDLLFKEFKDSKRYVDALKKTKAG